MAIPAHVTLEQFAAVFKDNTAAEIRAALKTQYGIEIPSQYNRDSAIKRAFTMLVTPAVVENPPPEDQPPPEPAGPEYLIRTTGVAQRIRAGRTWTHAWTSVQESDLSLEQWRALRADHRIMIRKRGE